MLLFGLEVIAEGEGRAEGGQFYSSGGFAEIGLDFHFLLVALNFMRI